MQKLNEKFNKTYYRVIETLDRLLHVDRSFQDPENAVAMRFFQFTTVTIFLVFGIFSISYLFLGVFAIAAVQGIFALVTLSSWLVYRKSKSLAVTGSYIMFFGSMSGFFRAYNMGGISSPAFYVWPIVPVFCGLIMPIRFAAIWTAVYMSIALYFHWAFVQGIQFSSKLTPEAAGIARIVTIVAVELLLLLAIYNMKKINVQFRLLLNQKKEDKTNLVRVLTHDLATPFMTMNLALERIKVKSPSPDVDKVIRALNACMNIMQQVRNMEAVESQKVALTIESVDLREVIQEVGFFQSEALAKKNIEFQIRYEPENENFMIMADKKALTYQVFSNILSNAIKFTEPGGKIEIILNKSKDGTIVRFIDSGVGIPSALIPILFDPTKKTSRTGTSGEKGTGFGMPIVMSYLKHFDANIDVTSKEKGVAPDHGTTISISFPNATLS